MKKAKKVLGLVLAFAMMACGTSVAFAAAADEANALTPYNQETLDQLGAELVSANAKGEAAYTQAYLQSFAEEVYCNIVPNIADPAYLPYIEPYFTAESCAFYSHALFNTVDPTHPLSSDLAYWQTFDFTQLDFSACGQEGTKEYFVNGIEQVFRPFWMDSAFRLLDDYETGEKNIVSLWLLPLLESNGIACSFDSNAVYAAFEDFTRQDIDSYPEASYKAPHYMAAVMVDLVMGYSAA